MIMVADHNEDGLPTSGKTAFSCQTTSGRHSKESHDFLMFELDNSHFYGKLIPTMTRDIEKQLRDAIQKSGLSANELEKRSGVSRSIIIRFAKGERTITMQTGAALAKILGIEFTEGTTRGN